MPDALGMTEAEAAAGFGIHPRTLRRWRQRGAIGFRLTPGGHVRYSSEDVRKLMDGMRIGPRLRRLPD